MSNERMDYESRRALVFQAATEIAETGQVPSLEAVKLKVGGGSYTTLTRALREWRKEKDRQQTAVEAPPEIVSDLAQRLAGDLWKAAGNLHRISRASYSKYLHMSPELVPRTVMLACAALDEGLEPIGAGASHDGRQ